MKKVVIAAIFALVFLTSGTTTHAGTQFFNPSVDEKIGNLPDSASGGTVLQLFLKNGINLAFGLGGLIFFIVLLRGAMGYITAGGDKDGIERSKKQLTTGFIGIAILFSVYAILFIVEVLFGISLRTFDIPTIPT